MKILVINGPNLNMLGIREKQLYGDMTYDGLVSMINDYCESKNIEVKIFQSNSEGKIVDEIQNAYNKYDGIIINPAAYTHTSIAILDALKSVNIRTVEVHITDIYKREDFRKIDYIKEYCIDSVIGEGINGYIKAINILINN